MKKFVNIVPVVIVVFSLIIISACSGGCNKGKNSDSVLTQIKKEQVKEDVADYIYPLPTAFEVTNMLNRIGASYILSLSNSSENSDKYFTEKSKALNLGIYSADLSYASTYNQKQIAIDYMNVSNKLIEELGFSEAIDKDLLSKIEKVENDKEKLIELISSTFYTTYEYLNKNDRGTVSLMVIAGSYVEALYIATHISEDTYNNVEMIKIVMEQKEPLNKLMGLLEDANSNDNIADVFGSLNILNEIYSNLEEGSITQEQMMAIATEVAVVRAAMVE